MQLVRRLGAGLMVLAFLVLPVFTLATGPAFAGLPAGAGAAIVLTRSSEGVALPSEPVLGKPVPWEIGLQPGYSPVKRDMIALNNLVLWIIIVITLFVAALLVWVIYRFNAKRNPVPAQSVHNTFLEIAWTIIPVLILVVIAIPSFRLVYYENKTYDPDMTIKVTAHQWYWEYTYPDQKQPRLHQLDRHRGQAEARRAAAADGEQPARAAGRARMSASCSTSSDVIHSFFIPSLGVQRYAIPGRHDRDLGTDRQARDLLRRMQPDLRHQPQPHADRRGRRDPGAVPGLVGGGEEADGRRGRAIHRRAASGGCRGPRSRTGSCRRTAGGAVVRASARDAALTAVGA